MTDREIMQQALEALEVSTQFVYADLRPQCVDAIVAMRERLAQPEPEQEPVAWADECRVELVTAVHTIASDYENALGAFGEDAEARRKAEGDIAHARKIVAKWNWNGRTSPPRCEWVGLTDEEIDDIYQGAGKNDLKRARAIEAKLREKNT